MLLVTVEESLWDGPPTNPITSARITPAPGSLLLPSVKTERLFSRVNGNVYEDYVTGSVRSGSVMV